MCWGGGLNYLLLPQLFQSIQLPRVNIHPHPSLSSWNCSLSSCSALEYAGFTYFVPALLIVYGELVYPGPNVMGLFLFKAHQYTRTVVLLKDDPIHVCCWCSGGIKPGFSEPFPDGKHHLIDDDMKVVYWCVCVLHMILANFNNWEYIYIYIYMDVCKILRKLMSSQY